jgi:hypothetical protein
MKTNDILSEGPLDAIKKAGAGIKGFAQGGTAGARAGYQSAEAGIKQKALINKVASKALQSWATISQNIKTSGQPVSVQDVIDWYKKFTNTTPTTRPLGVSPANVNQWLTKEIAGYMAKRAKAQPAQAQPQPSGTAQPQPTPGTTAQPQPGATGTPKPGTTAQPQPSKKVAKGAGDDYYMGGQKLDPKNPKEKAIIDRVKQQEPQPQQTPTPKTAQSPTPDAQKPSNLPDVSKLTPQERTALKKELKLALGVK